MSVDGLLNLSEICFPFLQNEDNNSIYLSGVLAGLKALSQSSDSLEFLIHTKGLIWNYNDLDYVVC